MRNSFCRVVGARGRKSVENLRSEVPTKVSHHGTARIVFDLTVTGDPLQEVMTTDVRGHDHDSVAEVDRSLLAAGGSTVVK